MHTYICTYKHTYIHTYIHTVTIHTYIHTYIHILYISAFHAYIQKCVQDGTTRIIEIQFHMYICTYVHIPSFQGGQQEEKLTAEKPFWFSATQAVSSRNVVMYISQHHSICMKSCHAITICYIIIYLVYLHTYTYFCLHTYIHICQSFCLHCFHSSIGPHVHGY